MNRQVDKERIIHRTENAKLVVRPALSEDALDVLRWRNDPHVRAMSRQDVPITEEVHRSWYSQALSDPDRLLVIGVLSDQKVGMVRFDRQEPLLWEVSIAVAPEVCGQGVGRRLLVVSLEYLQSVHASVKILAVAKSSNLGSLKLFLSLGFIRENDGGEFTRLILSFGSS